MTGTYKIADKIIQIVSLFPDVHEYCKDYLCEGKVDFTVSTSENDIDFERKRSLSEAIAENKMPLDHPAGYLEELAVYRKIAEKMIGYDTFLFHGSAVSVDGKAYLFTAKSGTGKSTHTKLWRRHFGNRAVMVNDDKPLIKISGDKVYVFGTPYNGKHRLGSNICVPLRSVALLGRSNENHIEEITAVQAYPLLLQQVYRPSDQMKMIKTLELLKKMTELIKLYSLGCNMEPEAVIIAYDAMK